MRHIATCAVALTLLGVGATSASAGESERIVANGGTAKFSHKGEILYVSDNIGDAASMTAELLNLSGSGSWWVRDSGADGDPSEVDISIREGSELWLRLCYTIDNEDHCSRWQTAVA